MRREPRSKLIAGLEVLLCVSLLMLSAEPSVDEAPAERRVIAAHVAFATGLMISNGLAIGLGYVPGRVQFELTGRPDPLVTATGLLIAGAAQLAIAYFVLPEAFALAEADVDATRAAAWRWERWPAIGGALGVLLFTVGAGVERDHFGRGQDLMIVGAVLSAAAYVAFDVLAILGASRGSREGH